MNFIQTIIVIHVVSVITVTAYVTTTMVGIRNKLRRLLGKPTLLSKKEVDNMVGVIHLIKNEEGVFRIICEYPLEKVISFSIVDVINYSFSARGYEYDYDSAIEKHVADWPEYPGIREPLVFKVSEFQRLYEEGEFFDIDEIQVTDIDLELLESLLNEEE